LYEFLKQSIREFEKASKKGKKRRSRIAQGEIQALSYTVALMDNPYRPDMEGVMTAARMEASNNE
jgi:hypothetical protein